MNTHTPGPWACEFHETAAGTPFGIVVGGKGKGGLMDTVICHAPDYRNEPVSYKAFKSANARLIAAAPGLLSALRLTLRALEAISAEMTVGERYTNAGQHLIDSLNPARAAIAEAEKEQA